MKDVSLVHSTFWTGTTGQSLRGNGDAQRVALYAITSPASHPSGLYAIALAAIAHDIGITMQSLKKAVGTLTEIGFLRYDEDWSWMWVVEMMRFQFGEEMRQNDNRVIGLQRYLDKFANRPFVEEFCSKYGATHGVVYRPSTKTVAELFDRYDGEGPPDEKKQKGMERAKQIREVIQHYKTYFPQRFRSVNSSLDEWKMIDKRMNEGSTPEDLVAAIDGLMRSPHHQGQNDTGTKYDGLAYAVKSAKQVQMMISMPKQRVVIADKNRLTVSAIQSRAEKRAAARPPSGPPKYEEPLSFGEFLDEGGSDAAR